MNEIVVVGASLAGAATARALRDAGYAGGLTVVGDEPHAPYDRPPLSKSFLLGDIHEADLALVDAAEELDVAWRIGARAVALEATTRTLVLDDGAQLRPDGIVLATGASALRLPGTERLEGIHVCITDVLRRFQGPAALKHTQSADEQLLFRRTEVVAPFDRRP